MSARTSAVVTGAGRGFGRAVATALVETGTEVVGIARTASDLDALHRGLGDAFATGRHSYQQSYIVWRCVGDGSRGCSQTYTTRPRTSRRSWILRPAVLR